MNLEREIPYWKRLNDAFKTLRVKDKLIAKQNFSCCASCGGYEIDEQAKKRAKRVGKYPTGYVFYHRQDTESMYNTGALMIRFGSFYTRNDNIRRECADPQLVAEWAIQRLNDAGFETIWNNDTSKCIVVIVDREKYNEFNSRGY